MLPMIIGGVISGLGSVVGGILGYKGQKDTNQANTAVAREQMEFQRDMVNQAQDFEADQSATAYQRAMDDMRKAGLNPMLAYQQGGASTPIGKTAPGAMPNLQNPMLAASEASMGVAGAASSVSTITSDAQQRENLRSKLENDVAYRELTYAQRQKTYQAARHIDEQIRLTEAETEGVEADNVQRQIVADFLQGNEFAGIAKWIGVSPSVLAGIFRTLFMKNSFRR